VAIGIATLLIICTVLSQKLPRVSRTVNAAAGTTQIDEPIAEIRAEAGSSSKQWLFYPSLNPADSNVLASSTDPNHQMSKSFDESDDAFKGPAIPEPTHTSPPPPSYSNTSVHHDLGLRGSGVTGKMPEGYVELELEELSAISPPPFTAHPGDIATISRRKTQ
jgi:hypothetical protein